MGDLDSIRPRLEEISVEFTTYTVGENGDGTDGHIPGLRLACSDGPDSPS